MMAALDKAIAILRTSETRGSNTTLTRRFRDVERTLANLTETAAKGGAVPAVLEALNRADAERRALLAEMKSGRTANVSSEEKATAVAVHDLRRTLRGYINDWHATLQGNVTEARGLLDVVLRERITFTPKTVNGVAMYELRIPIAFDRLTRLTGAGIGRRILAGRFGVPKGIGRLSRDWSSPLRWAAVDPCDR